jgi:hypothetical protein
MLTQVLVGFLVSMIIIMIHALAMKGILMFGWSTGGLFEVLVKAVPHLGSVFASGTLFSAEDRG